MKNLNEIIRFAKEGKSIQEIAKPLGYKTSSYISRVLNKYNKSVRRLLVDNDSIWYLHGKVHREDGPAVEGADGTRFWYLHGKVYCEDGPAVEGADSTRTWYWHGKELDVKSQEEFEKLKPLLLIQEIQES